MSTIGKQIMIAIGKTVSKKSYKKRPIEMEYNNNMYKKR